MSNKLRGFSLSDEDHKLLADYAYANRISASHAMRYLIRTCTRGEIPFNDVVLDDDNRQAVASIADQTRKPGRPDGELFNTIVNSLIRRGIKSR